MLLISLVMMLCSCSTANEKSSTDPNLNVVLVPDARITLGEEGGKIDVSLGLVNTSDQFVPVIDKFEGNWVLLKNANEIRARGAVLTAGPLDPNEADYPMVWSAKLEADTYILKWGSPSTGTVIVNFEVFGDKDSPGVGISRKETSEAFLIKADEKTMQ
jgi:hypothetical protein